MILPEAHSGAFGRYYTNNGLPGGTVKLKEHRYSDRYIRYTWDLQMGTGLYHTCAHFEVRKRADGRGRRSMFRQCLVGRATEVGVLCPPLW